MHNAMIPFLLALALPVSASDVPLSRCGPEVFAGTEVHFRSDTAVHIPGEATPRTRLNGHGHFDEAGQFHLHWVCPLGERGRHFDEATVDDCTIAGRDPRDAWELPIVNIFSGPADSCVVRLEWVELVGGYWIAGHVTDGDWQANPIMLMDGVANATGGQILFWFQRH